jgi:trimethylamine--corrinoid protein Co-methyltransferase
MASEAKYPGIQAGYEKALKGVLTAATGADLMSGGIGLLDSANLLFLPQIAIDAEVAAMIERILGGAEINSDTLLLDAVARVGIGGSYLSEKETSRRLRAGEQFLPQVSTRLPYDAWAELGKDEADIAWGQAQKTLADRAEALPYFTEEQRIAFARMCGEDGLSTGAGRRAARRGVVPGDGEGSAGLLQ